jgi:hypothetical protein
MVQKTTPTIKVKPKYRRRVPHKPTRAYRDRTKYDRRGKAAARRKKELSGEMAAK